MVLLSSFPYVESSLAGQGKWPVVAGSVSWSRGRLPSLKCVLLAPGGLQLVPAAARARRTAHPWQQWNSQLVARTRAIATALADTHKAWSTQSLHTLQRVGSIIRSTSLECIAALSTSAAIGAAAKGGRPASAAAAQQPTPAGHQEQQPRVAPGGGGSSNSGNRGGDENDDDAAASAIRAGLSRFLAAASEAEVSQAAMLSNLSNMAYDVQFVTAERLRTEHGLSLVASSRPATCPTAAAAAAAPGGQAQPRQLDAAAGAPQPRQLEAAPWPAPLAPLQAPGSGLALMGGRRSSSGSLSLPASPRTPVVLSSMSEGDDGMWAGGELHQPATAAACVADLGSPRRRCSAAAAANSGGVAVAPAAPAGAGLSPSSSFVLLPQRSCGELGWGLGADHPAALLLQHSEFLQDATVLDDAQRNSGEEALLQQLKQHEALLLAEMEANRQMLAMLQQQQQQQQQQAGGSDGSTGAQPLIPEPLMEVMADAVQAVTAAGEAAGYASALQQLEQGGGSAATAAGTPADWFCCDGPLPAGAHGTGGASGSVPARFFVIQGSITLQHWRINLTIDPVEFEGGALGAIKVHRGVYEAALEMYDALAPLVAEHLAAHPGGKVAFTGHSLGGSLATLLMLLYVHRGVLPAANVATVRTFGSPAIFCEGATGSAPSGGACQSCSLPCQHRAAAAASSAASASASLLARLGLPGDAVANVVMTRDIVPRAFMCDYTLVAGVLRSWLPSFKEHQGLAACRQHKALYSFVGTVEVLQPTADCDFVLPDEGGHTMLPPAAALYKLGEPAAPPAAQAQQPRKSSFGGLASLTTSLSSGSLSSALADLTSGFSLGASGAGAEAAAAGGASTGALGMVAVPVQADAAGGSAQLVPAAGRGGGAGAADGGLTLGDAILTFMNSPHPLQTLGEMRAYGPNGSISRYHNPNSYTKALQQLGGRGRGCGGS